MIRSTSDIVLLQDGRVLISDDNSVFCHCTRNMSTGEVRPTMDRTVCFGVLTTSSVVFFSVSDGPHPVSQDLSRVNVIP